MEALNQYKEFTVNHTSHTLVLESKGYPCDDTVSKVEVKLTEEQVEKVVNFISDLIK